MNVHVNCSHMNILNNLKMFKSLQDIWHKTAPEEISGI